MQTLKGLTPDKLINLYEGTVIRDRRQIEERDEHHGTPTYEIKQRMLAQDKMIPDALRCAKANGFIGE